MPEVSAITSVKNSKFIYLTTQGRKTGNPHTVELWFAYGEGRLFLSHEGAHTDWMKNLVQNHKAKVRIDELTFEVDGKLIDADSSSRELGKKALYEKYYGPASKEVLDDWFELSTVVELTPL